LGNRRVYGKEVEEVKEVKDVEEKSRSYWLAMIERKFH
jgi:hypothetical protein